MSTFGDLKRSTEALQLYVVLVEPEDPRNIGAVARAMGNLDVPNLRLVKPAKFDQTLARSVACWSASIIENASIFPTLEEAVADLHEVVGFASDSGQHRVPQLLLNQWIESLPFDPLQKIGLVFGSEEQGLRREHFPWCQYLIRIPSSGENRSYNLAQSVLLALFSLKEANSHEFPSASDLRADSKELAQYTEMVLRVAEDVGFLKMHSSGHIRELLTNVSRRGRLNTRELVILKGLFGTILSHNARLRK
jgi:tRNA (cytidine32/uridine32-2'-O)-methyltransferase